MSASTAEVQAYADKILELLGTRLQTGRIEIHYADGKVVGAHVLNVFRPRVGPRRPSKSLDSEHA